jgi:hypothetical protein
MTTKFMVLQPQFGIGVLPDGSGEYHIDEFGDNKEEALAYYEAAKSVSTPGHAKKIRLIEYLEKK